MIKKWLDAAPLSLLIVPSLAAFGFIAHGLSAAEVASYRDLFGFPSSVRATAFDPAGNVYLTGSTTSPNFPVTTNAFQKSFTQAVCGNLSGPHGTAGPAIPCEHGFVAKIDPTGTRLLYATYLGGNSQDSVRAIAVDAEGNAYVTGFTSSSNFPITPGAYLTTGSGFMTKLSADGAKAIFSTRLPAGGEAIGLDAARSVYVTGIANDGFPTTSGAFQRKSYVGQYDGFVLKLNPAGTNVSYATLIGGTFDDVPTALAVDSVGNAYIGGFTASTPGNSRLAGPDYVLFPRTPGAYNDTRGGVDVFVAKLNSDGSLLLFSSVFGGSGDDRINAIDVDAAGAVYFAGGTQYSPDFPTTPGAFQKRYGGGLVGKLSADGSQLIYSTYLGTGLADSVGRIAVDQAGHAFVSGAVHRPNFPATPTADQRCFPPIAQTNGGFYPTEFYAELNPAGSALVYATYANDVVAMDARGAFYSPGTGEILRKVDSSKPATTGIRCVANAASGRAGPIAPGEIISLFGPGIGPDDPASASPESTGRIPTTLSNIRVLISGIAAPLLYVSKNQINAVVPFELGGQNEVGIQIQGREVEIPVANVAVADSAPAAFTLDGSGYGQVAAVNEDGTINSVDSPAPEGSIVSLYLTGFGRMSPTPVNGSIPARPSTKPVLPVEVSFSSLEPVEVLYCGDAPGLVQGVVQMNIRVPKLFQKGQRPLSLLAGTRWSANAPLVTISVK